MAKLDDFDALLEKEQQTLIDCIQKDTGYTGDVELCVIKNSVTGREYDISFEEIIRKTVERIREALLTFR